jgi:predicted NUDIX family NTP pyrophosphohydrolase
MLVSNFNQFISESTSNVVLVGIAIIYQNRLLIVHPTNSSWHKSTCGIPKGHLEVGEDPMDGALRELMEETGIQISPDQLDPEPKDVDLFHNNIKTGSLIYWSCNIESLSEIGLSDLRVPKTQLQLNEVDWAGFVTAKEAYPKMTRSQLIILDRHLTLDN